MADDSQPGGLLGSLFGGGDLYGNVLAPEQKRAMVGYGLLAMGAKIAEASAPSRLPASPFGAFAQGAGAFGQAEQEAARNAMQGTLLGYQGQLLRQRLGAMNDFSQTLPGLLAAMQGGGAAPAPAGPSGVAGATTPPPGAASGLLAAGGLPGGPDTSAMAGGRPPPPIPQPDAPMSGNLVPGIPPPVGGGAPVSVPQLQGLINLPAAATRANAVSPGLSPIPNAAPGVAGAPPGAQLASAAGAGQAPMSVPSGGAIDPRALLLAAAGSRAQMAGLGDVMKPFETALYGSPGYQGQVEGAKARARVGPELYTKWNSPMELRSTAMGVNPATGAIFARNPAVPEGYTVESAPGTPAGVAAIPVPGAQQGITAVEQAKKAGELRAEYGNLVPNGGPGTVPPPAPGATPGQPSVPLSAQSLPQSAAEAHAAIPKWQEHVDQWTSSIEPARQAQVRLMSIADAYKLTEPGAFATQKAELAAGLKALGMDPATIQRYVTSTDPSAVQLALHENYLQTLTRLKAANSRFTGQEFKVTSENAEHPNIQPAANLEMLSQDIAIVRQAQQIPADWNRDQQLGWRNPISYETAWKDQHPLQPLVDQIKQEIGPLKGMPGGPGSPPAPGAALPAGVPPGSTFAGHSPSAGLNYYKGPDGKFYPAKP